MSALTPGTIQSFLDYLKFEKRYSPHTISSYETDLTAFFVYLEKNFGVSGLQEINGSFIRSWLASMKEEKITSRTINRKISSLRSFFKYHVKRGAISTMPTANVIAPKISRRLPVFIKESETKQLIETLNQSSEDWKSLNARMLITLFYSTGMRLSELLGLKPKQVDTARSQIRVWGKGNKERIIPVNRDLIDLIGIYEQEKKKHFAATETGDETMLVTEKGKKLYPRYAWALVNKYLGQATTLDKKSPHVLRHTFATHLMNNGADLNAVKELLGHASLAATQVYTHNTIEKLKDVHKKAHPKA
jgi:integrase/recombinase XerC